MSFRAFLPKFASIALVASFGLAATQAGNDPGVSGSLENLADREIARRQQNLVLAEKLRAEGRKALANKEYEKAYVRFLDAMELIPAGEAGASVRPSALREFSDAALQYANWLVTQGRYADAEQVAKTILLPQFNPGYRPAVQFLSRLEQPDWFNKTVTPEFAASQEQVVKLLQEAEGFYATGRFDLATRRYESVLAIDPYNSAARRGMEQVNNQRSNYYTNARNETRSRMLWEVTKAWEQPVPRREANTSLAGGFDTDIRGTELIQSKLNRIIIPRINLQDTTLREAVTFLQQQSERLDTSASDSGQRGVNIFLKLNSGTAPMGAEGETGGDVAVSPNTRINLSLNNVPLFEALRYLGEQAGLKVKVEPFAVALVPLSEPTESLITKEYRVPPGFIPVSTAADEGGTGGFNFQPRGEVRTPGPGIQGRQNAQKFLEENGVTFPPGATARYIPAGSKLVVRNTPDNIDLIDSLVDAAVGAPPTQVEIETKFLEISQNNLQELGFDWMLGPFRIPDTGVYVSGGDRDITGVYPFSTAGMQQITSGLRTGVGVGDNAAITANSIDALLSGGTGLLGPAPGVFGISGIFTNPQFQVLIRALDQKKGVDLLSAPKVTTKSGQRANVSVVRTFFYPTQFTPPEIPGNTGSSNNGGGGIVFTDPRLQPPPTVTPAFPDAFESRDIGVILEVEPIVGADSYTIDLNLSPQVVDFDGFIDYGSPITSVGYVSGFFNDPVLGVPVPADIPVSSVLTNNVINQPIFSVRRVTTNVTIWDGQTVALGGLIREDTQKVEDKVPIIGDIPLAGRLFRSNVDQKIKKNLVIFVTAQIIDAEGRPIRRDEEEEDTVDPLGLPESLPGPTFPAFKGGGK